ncbi:PP2C family protein-serine/threonine phosphatase [Heliorestis convoluta]|uniref:Response regulator n=1 Tax=Heliorestis convoluta TaxID=356322 RepID=A0A5Q2MWI4_9FIRM|nr:PP2C family protein-serine/threonine phosphatase [Heliorestis convoluta]QGG46768.1 Response regulator [Heliorestis convoluta]
MDNKKILLTLGRLDQSILEFLALNHAILTIPFKDCCTLLLKRLPVADVALLGQFNDLTQALRVIECIKVEEPLLPIIAYMPELPEQDKWLLIEKGLDWFFSSPLNLLELRAVMKRENRRFRFLRRYEQQMNQVEVEIQVARQIMNHLLPKKGCFQNIEVQWIQRPHSLLGGDMFYYYDLPDEKLALFLIDVSGHGLTSSMVTMALRSLLKGVALKVQEPIQVMTELNRHICDLFMNLPETIYAACTYCIVDRLNQCIHYSNAGNPDACLFGTNGTVQKLKTENMALGIYPDLEFQKKTIRLQEQQRLALFTDGIYDKRGSLESKFALRDQVIQSIALGRDLSLAVLCEQLEKSLDKSLQHSEDDYSLLLVQW